ncbi:MAG: AraC family ligand binding domain-containing protein [Firmicutes bacterium]|nr:AraC family ligand binding domain-containing protein [Bacillota bacterium]
MENSHYHNSFEIYYLLSGNRKMLVEDRVYEFCTSDIVLINPNILHRNSAPQ